MVETLHLLLRRLFHLAVAAVAEVAAQPAAEVVESAAAIAGIAAVTAAAVVGQRQTFPELQEDVSWPEAPFVDSANKG